MATATRDLRRDGEGEPQRRPLTIGAVCSRLKPEFPDISISKIRYLEDQGLLTPRRTQGGYRLFAAEDVARLETILRLQRDEFLPLRVIRQELASPGRNRDRGRTGGLRAPEVEIGVGELCERGGADREFVRELEEFGLLESRLEGGRKLFPERDVEVVAACGRLARFGIDPRNMRKFRMDAENEADLLERALADRLLSPKPERRLAGLETLEELAVVSQELSQLLFWRALRSRVARS
jgi:DNA-binding transcriptional MerR regulator